MIPAAIIAAEAAVWRDQGELLWNARQARLDPGWLISGPSKASPPAPQAAALPQAPSPSDRSEFESGRQPLAAADPGAGTLVIGRQIVLSGEVTSCNRLVVEGTIKANIKDMSRHRDCWGWTFHRLGRSSERRHQRAFRGWSHSERPPFDSRAEPRFRHRSISGTVQYRELEIERGGRIAGNVSPTRSA